MIQLLIGLCFVLAFLIIPILIGVLIIFIINNFINKREYYDWYNIFYYGWRGFALIMLTLICIIVIWGIGDIILLNFK